MAPEWQPISTAPGYDGPEGEGPFVLLFVALDEMHIGRFAFMEDAISVWDCGDYYARGATHWMPLPPPPKS